jgi:hypothetical protein
VVGEAVWLDELPLPTARPAAAPPAAIAAIAIHFFLPEPPDRGDFATGVSEMYCEQIAPARDSPFAAVIRIWKGPAMLFHRMP